MDEGAYGDEEMDEEAYRDESEMTNTGYESF